MRRLELKFHHPNGKLIVLHIVTTVKVIYNQRLFPTHQVSHMYLAVCVNLTLLNLEPCSHVAKESKNSADTFTPGQRNYEDNLWLVRRELSRQPNNSSHHNGFSFSNYIRKDYTQCFESGIHHSCVRGLKCIDKREGSEKFCWASLRLLSTY